MRRDVEEQFDQVLRALSRLAREGSPDWTCRFCGAEQAAHHADTCGAKAVADALFTIRRYVEGLETERDAAYTAGFVEGAAGEDL